jgi:hypothetical protein
MGGDARAHQARVERRGGRSTCPSRERWGSYREGSAMRRLRGRPSRESPSRRPPKGPTPLGQLWVLLWLLPLTPSPSFLCYYSLSCLVGFRETHKHLYASSEPLQTPLAHLYDYGHPNKGPKKGAGAGGGASM